MRQRGGRVQVLFQGKGNSGKESGGRPVLSGGKKQLLGGCAWWFVPVVPATGEAEAVMKGLLESRRLRVQ